MYVYYYQCLHLHEICFTHLSTFACFIGHDCINNIIITIPYNYQSTGMQQVILPTVDDPNAYKLVSVEMPRPPSMKVKTEDDLEIERLQVQHIHTIIMVGRKGKI